MKATNLGKADGLPTIEWSQVEPQLADLLMHDDPRSPNRSTFWLTALNADGSPHVTSVGALWRAVERVSGPVRVQGRVARNDDRTAS